MRTRARKQIDDQAACWDELRTLLAAEHITFIEPDAWTPQIREFLGTYFTREIYPVLTPLAFDPGHPFPLISNLSKNFAVVVKHGNRTKFARVKVPDVLPRFIRKTLPSPRDRRSSSSRTSFTPTCRSSSRERR
jgi:polyphosphate kinase